MVMVDALRRFARRGQIGVILWACLAVAGIEGFPPKTMAPQNLREHVTIYYCHGYLELHRQWFLEDDMAGKGETERIPLPELPPEPHWRGYEGGPGS